VREGDLVLTPPGQEFAAAEGDRRKKLFARQIADLPLIALIRRVLDSKRNRTMPKEFFMGLLEEHFADEEAQHQMDTAISWGRYAELFYYDPAAEELYLEEPVEPVQPPEGTGGGAGNPAEAAGGTDGPAQGGSGAAAGQQAHDAAEEPRQTDDADQ
jgi:hypothetical protein